MVYFITYIRDTGQWAVLDSVTDTIYGCFSRYSDLVRVCRELDNEERSCNELAESSDIQV